MLISMIAAVGENLELGAANTLLWHLPDDFSWFIKHTKGKALIMGRKTMESLGKPLKGRTNIVLTSMAEVLPGFELAHNWEQALEMAKNSIHEKWEKAAETGEPLTGEKEIMIIGGGEIYKQALSFADRIYLTKVQAKFDTADTYFPKMDDAEWLEVYNENHEIDDKHQYAFRFIIWEKHKNHGSVG
jgi:dihydrofolate reductase